MSPGLAKDHSAKNGFIARIACQIWGEANKKEKQNPALVVLFYSPMPNNLINLSSFKNITLFFFFE